MAKKAAKGRSKDTDQFIVRMPPGMRDTFAKLAEEHGRSMNAEVVTALANYIALHDGEPEYTLADIKRSLDAIREQFVATLRAADPDAVLKHAKEALERQK